MKQSLFAFLFLFAATAQAQSPSLSTGWSDGTPSRLQHHCVVTADSIDRQEDLVWTGVGFQGLPNVGDTYYVRLTLTGMGCSGVWVRPEVKLPLATNFAIDGGHPIKCFTAPVGSTDLTAVTSDCPTAPAAGQYPDDGGDFPNPSGDQTYNNFYWAFIPTDMPDWAIPPGQVLYIEFPVISTKPLAGASGDDYFLAATGVVDNNPGGAAQPWDGVGNNFEGLGVPTQGPWQGAFVYSQNDPSVRLTYTEPSAESVTGAGATLCVHVFNTNGNECPAFPANPAPPLAITLTAAGSNAPVGSFISSDLSPTSDAGGVDVCMTYGGLSGDTLYEWSAGFFDNNQDETKNQTYGCAFGADIDPTTHYFQTPPVPTPAERYVLMTLADSPGTLALTPPDGSYAPGTSVSVAATGAMGFSLASFALDGGAAATTSPYVLTMSGNHTLLAHFTPNGKAEGTVVTTTNSAKKSGCVQSTPGELALFAGALLLLFRKRRER